jgi:alkaline phosphatase D
MKKVLFGLVLVFLQAWLYSSCTSSEVPEGPYFGNGVHNGWADQNSIVIWTRLTQNPEGNAGGTQFLLPDNDEVKALDKGANHDSIMMAQIPEGLKLDDMIGACPGAGGEVKLRYYPQGNEENAVALPWAPVDPEKNFTRQWKLEGLSPGTRYSLQVEARAKAGSAATARMEGEFQTPPAENQPKDVTFCVVTCHDYIRKDSADGHKIYPSMSTIAPDFYVHTGDIEYYDKPLPWAMTEELMYFKWDRLFALSLQRDFWSRHTTYFMKDDHDALKNDAWPGSTYGTVSWDRGLEIFDKEQFPSNEKPYKTIRWGRDLQIWLTEGRNYRSRNTDPDGPGKSIWGKEQKGWLFNTMKASDATFKVLISNDPILGPDRKNKKDNYSNSNWQYEGDEIRAFLNSLVNVYICNGDRHWQYVTHLEGTSLWEFSCGPGADMHAGGWGANDKRPEHRFLRVLGGFLKVSVSTKNEKSMIIFEHCDVDGNVVHSERFQANLKV